MKTLLALVLLAFVLVAPPAFAAGEAGKALGVADTAKAAGKDGKRPLAVGSDLYIGDLVATDATGQVQIRFSDDTRMVVGANSSLVIDQALFRGNASENKFAVRALGGAFRFISGDSGDKGFSIRTPTGTIGVRGTAFDFVVTPGGGTSVVVIEGEVELCEDKDGKPVKEGEERECAIIATPCAVAQIGEDDDDKPEVVPPGPEREKMIRETFPLTQDQQSLLDEFKLGGVPCIPGGVAPAAVVAPTIPTDAILVGGLVVVGGAILILLGDTDSNNNTNGANTK